MAEKITLRIVWLCMVLCATTVLSLVWFAPVSSEVGPPFRVQIALTFFIVGLGHFLIWAPLVIYRFWGR